MRRILFLCLGLLMLGCARVSLYDEAYRDGKISHSQYRFFKQQDRDFLDGKGKYPFGGEGEARMLESMLLEPIPFRMGR